MGPKPKVFEICCAPQIRAQRLKAHDFTQGAFNTP
jgi:hypothetical protein